MNGPSGRRRNLNRLACGDFEVLPEAVQPVGIDRGPLLDLFHPVDLHVGLVAEREADSVGVVVKANVVASSVASLASLSSLLATVATKSGEVVAEQIVIVVKVFELVVVFVVVVGVVAETRQFRHRRRHGSRQPDTNQALIAIVRNKKIHQNHNFQLRLQKATFKLVLKTRRHRH